MFIGSSKRSLKFFLPHNDNLFGAVLIAHSACLREENGDVKRVIELLQYDKHNWIVCVDFKMVYFLLDSNVDTQRIPAFSVCGATELDRSIALRRVGLRDLILKLDILTSYKSHLLTGKFNISISEHKKLMSHETDL